MKFLLKEGRRQKGRRGDFSRSRPLPSSPLPLSPSPLLPFFPSPKGVIALITVILIGAIILAVGISAAFIGQTESILAGHADREQIARSLASACIEDALHRLKLNLAYTGGTVPIGSDSCTVTVSGSGSTRTITATASSAEFAKSISVGASLRQNAVLNARAWHIDSWAEADPP